MPNVLVINATLQETRVAVLENGTLSDFYLERRRNVGVVGNIYRGRVLRVLPGMQAAFVDIGLEKAGFLYVNDVYQDHQQHELEDDEDEGEEDDEDGEGEGEEGSGAGRGRAPRRRKGTIPPIEDQLKEGQELLVQVIKDPIGTKGARITCHITLPGRHLVFMPTVDHVGISRQIASEKERRRLRDIANEMRPRGSGFIVRTASAGVASEHLRQDMRMLINLWNRILEQRTRRKAPACLHEDLDLLQRAARDLSTADMDRLVIDNRDQYERIIEFMKEIMPHHVGRVELYVGQEPIFDAFGIEAELRTALSRNVPLPSGGYLVIEKTEALTSIDINTGRFVGKRNLEETILKTNVEAAWEIAYQIRLRGIGGLIIIDFIDMENAANRDAVNKALEQALQNDRGRVKVTRISEFGIVEMTRKRTRESLEQMLCEPCDHCKGSGVLRSRETMAYEILRDLRRQAPGIPEFDIHVLAHPRVIGHLESQEKESLRTMELRFTKKIHLKPTHSMHIEQHEIVGQPLHQAPPGNGRPRGNRSA
jgi:ribonuclease G